ncbi:DUF4133 domain-containing protein [Flavitalea sp. BT771]|uniref:DUF4133 domain-containing protein n=1 Tax=Flavitalea sp. BT771 TaxID=3063329 RepID=UPI0026E40DC0|nr:DUF4133 domain-containing protein [Flavitalea sp. BT771]MDO6433044.1 DUF4133 domain-containing protein [Flavitalea sp. BT771]MDV6221680.1 DUF4133 domain-containing protein [Flavitalea sp. BT771]
MHTLYQVHRRVNTPIELNGLKGQYILYAGGTVLADLFLFAILYIAGVSSWVCLVLCFGMGVLGIGTAYHFSGRYGVYGWRKQQMAKQFPKALRSAGRSLYAQLKNRQCNTV